MVWNTAFYGEWIPLGKKSSETDVVLASHSSSEGTFSFACPGMYPEKVHSLIMPAMLSNLAVVHYTPALQGAGLGETIVLLSLLQKPGFFAVSQDSDQELLDRLVKGTSLEKWERVEDTEVSIREQVKKFEVPVQEGTPKILVDASFEVKSVGTVILGVVQQGTVKVYDKLIANPSGKECMVKSIQKQDKNFKEAGFNDRVGLSIKGVTPEDVPRGTILCVDKLPTAKEFNAKVTLSPFTKELPHDIHLCLGLQWGAMHWDGSKVTSKKEWVLDGTGILAHNTKPGTLRVLGKLEL